MKKQINTKQNKSDVGNKMSLELIESDRVARSSRHGFPTITVYKNGQRFVLNREAVKLLNSLSDEGLAEYIQTFKDTKQPDVFYVKPCKQTDPGARKIGRTSRKTGRDQKYFDGKATFRKLNWKLEKGTSIRVLEDKMNPGFILVDRNEAI